MTKCTPDTTLLELVASKPELIDNIRTMLANNIYYDHTCYDDAEPTLKLPKNCSWCEDGSVSGGEIKLKTPSTLIMAHKALIELSRNVNFSDLNIDTRCSFHIHISEKSMYKGYEKAMQVAMLQYIYENLDKVPKNILQRWGSANRNARDRYFGYSLDSAKYNFISYRPDYGTWEFRCFGNIQSSDDGLICLRLAMAAYKWAVKNKGSKKILKFIDMTAKVDMLLGKRLSNVA
jgi:hypothetical protein